MQEPIISVSGLRGILGQSLDPALIVRYCAAFAGGLPPGPLVVGRDGRGSGRMLADLVCGALAAAGRDVLDAQVAATPTLGVLVRERNAVGGVQISASHNPPEYNGLKLFDGSGRVLPAEVGQAVVRRFRQAEFSWVGYERLGRRQLLTETCESHLRVVLETVDVEAIRRCGFRVLLDSNEGAGSLLGQQLLDRLGCQVHLLGGGRTGQFRHPPEPTRENLQDVGREVVQQGAAVGFCQDPDADRLALIDEQGQYVGEEYTLAICLEHVLRQTPGPVVVNCATSSMNADLAARYGVPLHRAAVGEANVVDRMLEVEAVYGGEGNGGPIDPRVGLVRDSFVGMAQVLDALAARQQPLSQLVGQLPSYGIHKTTVAVDRAKIAAALDRLEARYSEATADRQDGLRLDWPQAGWLLVRASNTEPIVRLIAEAETVAAARQRCEEAAAVIAS